MIYSVDFFLKVPYPEDYQNIGSLPSNVRLLRWGQAS